ncbi:MAG: adenylate kinase [Clostridia bacterium]|nr:adenylate kinase [Clostridia bacterium]MBQ5488218.1 adenylate kinase [Clostridia bacterium]
MKLILLGPPGAGKGTQAAKIAERYSLAHISTGDMLRAEIASGTPLGLRAKALIDNGELVPDEIIIGMVENRIKQDDCVNGFLLDGFPRTIPQAERLLEFSDIDRAVCIDVPDDSIIDRMARRRVCPACKRTYSVDTDRGDEFYCAECGTRLVARDDDKPETVRHRLSVYAEQTFPLIEFFRERELLSVVNGMGAVDDVAQNIFDLFEDR